MLIKSLHNERKKLVESLSHIRSILETFVDQFIFFFIQLLQQQQQRQLATLEEHYSATIKTRTDLDQIHLLETLARENLVRHFRHDDDITEQLDWFNQLAQFLIQGWLQASRILRSFASPITNNHPSTSQRLRYSFAFKLLNEERQKILLFLQQTIGQLKEKYPRMELLNDEPVVVYLIRLTKLLRYELMRMSTTNLKQLKSDLNNADRRTLRATLSQVKMTTDEWNKEIDLLLLQRKTIKERWLQRTAEEFFGRVRSIEERNRSLEKEYQLKCRQVEERIQKSKTHSTTILRDVKLIGTILHEAKFKSNQLEISDTDNLTNDVVQLVRQLVKAQQTIPQSCRFDNEQESKDLMHMICVDSVRIEVVKVEYAEDKPAEKPGLRDMWDNKIELSREGHETESVSGSPKPLISLTRSNYVRDLFTHSVQLPADTTFESAKTWTLRLFAGIAKDEKWTEMAVIPLRHADLSSIDKRETVYKFGKYKLSRINLRITPVIAIRLCDTPIEEVASTTNESVVTTDTTSELAGEDEEKSKGRLTDLRAEYQLLTSYERSRKLGKWILDLRRMCREIEDTLISKYIVPDVPAYYIVPKQDDTSTLPRVAMEKDIRSLKVSSPSTHHFLMTQLSSKYELLEETVVQAIAKLNDTINDNELNRVEHGISLEFDSADALKHEMNIFQATFRFEKLVATLSELHKASIVIQVALQSALVFQQALDHSLSNLRPHGFLVQLIDRDGSMSKESIEKLYTKQLQTLLQDGCGYARAEFNFAKQIYRILILIELSLIQLIIHPLDTKEHCEQAIDLVEKIKQYWLQTDQRLLIGEKEVDVCQTVIDETLVLVHERKKHIRPAFQPPRIANLNEISKAVNVKTLMQSTGSPSTSELRIGKQHGEYFSSHPSLIIQMEPIIQNWPSAQLKSKTIQLINTTDDEIDFELVFNATDPTALSVFVVRHSSSVVSAHDGNSVKITANGQANEGKYREKWLLKFAHNRLIIPILLCCEIKQFAIGIDLPLAEPVDDDQQVKTYAIDFGTELAWPNTRRQRTFTVKNPTTLDLRVKLRREGGAIGMFDVDSKHADFFLFAYESKTLTIDWNLQDLVQDARCVYEIYFSKDSKCRIRCSGQTRKITYNLIYQSVRLTEKQFRKELEPCSPGTILYEELTVHNTGDLRMTMKAKSNASSSTASVAITLSHEQVVLEPNASLILRIELRVNHAHRSIDNQIDLFFPNASQRPSFKLLFKTTAGWPELDQYLLSPLTKLQVHEDVDERDGQITLYNRGSVQMLINDLHSTSPQVIVNDHPHFPWIILPRQQMECHYRYKVEKKFATFDCKFVLITNCEEPVQRIPFRCIRMAPIIPFDPTILHCGTSTPGAKVTSVAMTIRNDGNLPAHLEYEPKANAVFTLKFNHDEKSVALSTQHPRSIRCLVEIKTTAPLGYFKTDVPLRVRSSEKTVKDYKLIVTGRVEAPADSTDKVLPIDFPSSMNDEPRSETEQRLMKLLEDDTDQCHQRAATALAPIIVTFDNLAHAEPKRTDIPNDFSCDPILTAIESDEPNYAKNVEETLRRTLDSFTTIEWRKLSEKMEKTLDERFSKAILGEEGKSDAENLSVAVDYAGKVSILLEEHSRSGCCDCRTSTELAYPGSPIQEISGAE